MISCAKVKQHKSGQGYIKDGLGLKPEKSSQIFPSFNDMPAKITKKCY